MQKKFMAAGAVVLIVAASAFLCYPALSNDIADAPFINEGASKDTIQESMKWYTMAEAIELQKTTGKKIMIDVYTTWCGPCRMLSTNTFTNPVIQKELSEYFIPTKFNAECGDTVVFKGQTYTNPNYTPEPRKSTHQFAMFIASTPQGLGYPTMVFLDGESNMIQPISGYLTPQQLEPILAFFGTDAYKTVDWNTYFASFKTNISQ